MLGQCHMPVNVAAYLTGRTRIAEALTCASHLYLLLLSQVCVVIPKVFGAGSLLPDNAHPQDDLWGLLGTEVILLQCTAAEVAQRYWWTWL